MAKTATQRQIEKATGVSRMQTEAARKRGWRSILRRKSRGGQGG